MMPVVILTAQYLYIPAFVLFCFVLFGQHQENKVSFILFSLIVLTLIYLTAKILGMFYFDPRPFVENHVVSLIPHAPDNGFPSDHTLLVAAFASILYIVSRSASFGLWCMAIAIGVSRVVVGVHHPIDILGGMGIAAIVTIVAHFFLKKKFLHNTLKPK